MEIISGVERRRRWSKEAKLATLAEADQSGVRIGDVARAMTFYPAQIRLWRKTLSHFDVSATFLPVHLVNEVSLGQIPAAGRAPAPIKIPLLNGRRVKVPADIERKMLSSLIACLEST
jgi:transposase